MKIVNWLPPAIGVLSLSFLLTGLPVFASADCISDCKDQYQSDMEDCQQQNDSPDDANDLQTCVDDAHDDYESCVEECALLTIACANLTINSV
jgi:hypothetical protein